MDGDHCYPANIILIIWGIYFLLGISSRGGMDVGFFTIMTVIILGVSGLMKSLCKNGHNKVSWLLVFTPFIIIGYIGSRV